MGDNKKDHHGDSKDHDNSKERSLDEKVDWMTFTHQQLYDMVHKGVNLETADVARGAWGELSTKLNEIKTQLLQAVVDSSEGWRGDSAQKARDGLLSVVDWAESTSAHAKKVETCIGEEIRHVADARRMMPEPVPAPLPLVPVTAGPVAAPLPTPVAPTAISPFTRARVLEYDDVQAERLSAFGSPVGIDSLRARPQVISPFTGIGLVGAPVVDATANADATHRQAASVMALFQESSYAVDQTVPQFIPPTNPVAPLVTPPTTGPGTGPAPLATDGSTLTSSTTAPEVTDRPHAAAAAQRGGGAFSSMRGDFAAGGFSAVMANPAMGGGGGGGGSALGGAGGSTGVLGNAAGSAAGPGASAAAASAGGQSSTRSFSPGGGGMMGAPMAPGGAPAGRGDDERDYQRASYLEDDDNLFGVERKAAPPVIGQ